MVVLCWDVLKGKGVGGFGRGLWKGPPRWRRKQRRLCVVCGPGMVGVVVVVGSWDLELDHWDREGRLGGGRSRGV